MSKHYDVVVVGSSLGALTAAALLARRSWRVLLIGSRHRSMNYHYAGLSFARRSFVCDFAGSPVWRRVESELGIGQTVKRASEEPVVSYQLLAPGLRVDMPRADAGRADSLERDFPAERPAIDQALGEIAAAQPQIDRAWEEPSHWPTDGFWAMRSAKKALRELAPMLEARPTSAPGLQGVFELPAQFMSHESGAGTSLSRLRHAGNLLDRALELDEDHVTQLMVERVEANGGEVAMSEAVVEIRHDDRKVIGVALAQGGPMVGATFVVSDASSIQLHDEFGVRARGARRLVARERRFVMTVLVHERGVPELLARRAFLRSDAAPTERLFLERRRAVDGTVALVVEAHGMEEPSLARARERILAVLEATFPYLERNYVAIDSPQDGRPLWDLRGKRRKEIDRALTKEGGGSLQAEPMPSKWELRSPYFFGLAGDALENDLRGLYAVGPTVLPSLGREGELLAAWNVAKRITETDKTREEMMLSLWRKVELR